MEVLKRSKLDTVAGAVQSGASLCARGLSQGWSNTRRSFRTFLSQSSLAHLLPLGLLANADVNAARLADLDGCFPVVDASDEAGAAVAERPTVAGVAPSGTAVLGN